MWMLKPSAPAIAGHVRLSKPYDTLLWYPTARVASAPDNHPLSLWYIGSVIDEVRSAKQCVVAVDDLDLFGDVNSVIEKMVDACRDGGCQLVATVRSKPMPKDGMVVIEIPPD